MTVRFLKVMILLGGLLACTPAMHAQSEMVTVHVPFAFEAGGRMLPAGDYAIDRAETTNIVVIHGSGNASAFLTMVVDSAAKATTASLVFTRQSGALVLSAIRLPGQQSRVLLPTLASVKGGVAAVSVSSR